MKVIPKLQQGGSFDSFFTVYQPIFAQSSKSRSSSSSSGRSSRTSSSDSTKGELTEKDFFTMLKDLDGLPNEKRQLAIELRNTITLSRLQGDTNIKDIASTYLSTLIDISDAKQNKIDYYNAVKKAEENGAMSEPAITGNGEFVVKNKQTREYTTVSLQELIQNKDQYGLLTVGNLAYLRANDMDFVKDQDVFQILNSSVGLDSFQKTIDSVIKQIGEYSTAQNGFFTIQNNKIVSGLQLLQNMAENDQVQALDSVSLDGLYEYKIVDKNQLDQMNAALNYMTAVLPKNMKVWAAYKIGNSNENEAARQLVTQYILGKADTTHQFNIDYHGSLDKVSHSGTKENSGSKSAEDPKEGFWAQVASGKGGTPTNLVVIPGGKSIAIMDSKHYGTTPGLDENKSLSQYIGDSNVGFMIENARNITFGDIPLSDRSFEDVMVNSIAGAHIATLPIDQNGRVNLDIIEQFEKANNKLCAKGLTKGTEQYQKEFQKLLDSDEYLTLKNWVSSNGQLNPKNSRQFLMIEGITSSKAFGFHNNTDIPFDRFKSSFVIPVGDDKDLYQKVERALSNKEKGEYKLDYNEWYDIGSYFGNYDKLYKGIIYIPLNNARIDAMNADKNDIKESTAHRYDEADQTWRKTVNESEHGSDVLGL